jgi:hypothetical protein
MPRLSHLYSPPADAVAGEGAVTKLRERLKGNRSFSLLVPGSSFISSASRSPFTSSRETRNEKLETSAGPAHFSLSLASTSNLKLSGTIGGRGRGWSAVGAGAGPNSAVTV